MSRECTIPKDATILFGSGGSQTIIVVTKDKRVYKYFPVIYSEIDSSKVLNKKIKAIDYEIDKLKKLTSRIKIPHLVKLIRVINCTKVSNSLFKRCNDFATFLTSNEKAKKECEYLYNNHPYALYPKMKICELEYCPYTLKYVLNSVIKKNIKATLDILDRVIFQVCFTLLSIQKTFPYFIHGDLHKENILCDFIKSHGNKFNRYKIHGLTFDVPINGIHIKLNDFQFTKLDRRDFTDVKFNKYPLFDLFTLFLSIILHYHRDHRISAKKINEIDIYLSEFININSINIIGKLDKIDILNFNRISIIDPKVFNLIKLKSEKEILSIMTRYFPVSDNNIIETVING